MLQKFTIKDFLVELSSEKATPGGGSTAALAGAIAAALVAKVAKISGDEKIAEKSERFGSVLRELIDKDAEAYEAVVLTYRLLKRTEEEKKIRNATVQLTLKRAAEVPLQTARYAYEIMKLTEVLAEKVNPKTASELGEAILLAEASIISALLNVKINLNSIEGEEGFKREISKGIGLIADYPEKAKHLFEKAQACLN